MRGSAWPHLVLIGMIFEIVDGRFKTEVFRDFHQDAFQTANVPDVTLEAKAIVTRLLLRFKKTYEGN